MIDWLQKQCTVAQAMEIKEIKKFRFQTLLRVKFLSKNIQFFFIKYENHENCVPNIKYQLSQMFMDFFLQKRAGRITK